MRHRWLLLLFAPLLWAQNPTMPYFLGQTLGVLPPAVDAAGRLVLFGSSITPDGASTPVSDLYVVGSDGTGLRRLTRLPSAGQTPLGVNAVSLSPDAAWAAFSVLPAGSRSEEVHLLDVARGTDRTLALDKEGCIMPLLACVNCFFSCIATPHVAPDGTYVLYTVRRQNPFYMVRADGSAPRNLPIYSGFLASAPQRVISNGGMVVLTANAPFGPTFAPSFLDVYLMKSDGTGLQNVTRFTDVRIYASEATISADGSTIAFLSNADPATGRATEQTQVLVIAADGSNLRQITSGTDPPTSPSLSADGSRVVYSVRGQVFAAPTSGRGPIVQLTSFKNSAASDSVLSGDGSLIAFTVGPLDGGRGAIYTAATGGGAPRAVFAPQSLNPYGISGAVAGSLASAYGTNFTADTITGAASLPLPETLAGVSLTMNGIALPMLAVSPWQVNAQIPPLSEGLAAFELRFADGFRSAPVAAEVAGFGPSIYLLSSIRTNQAAALHGNSSTVVGPANPAAAGQVIQVYASGLGPTNPVIAAGAAAPANPPAVTTTLPVITIGGRASRVLFSGLAPGLAGVYQVNVVVPEGLRPGDAYVSIQAGGVSGPGGMIAVR